MNQQDERGADAVACNAGQQQSKNGHAAMTCRYTHDEDEHERGAGQRTYPYARSPGNQMPAHCERDDRAERGARRHAQRIRRRQCFAEHRLEETSSKRQGGASEKTEQRARQSQVDQDRPVGLLARPDACEIDRRGSNERKCDRCDCEDDGTAADPGASPGNVRHWYQTQGRPAGVTATSSRGENNRSQSGAFSASAVGRSTATTRSARTRIRVQNVNARLMSCVTAMHVTPRRASSRSRLKHWIC